MRFLKNLVFLAVSGAAAVMVAKAAAVTVAKAATVDTIIIGGGFSGLQTAKTLAAAGKSYLILEARNRTGGRVKNAQLPVGGYTEVGGEFFGPTQDYAIDLAKELGVALFPVYSKGDTIYYLDGQRTRSPSTGIFGLVVPATDPISLFQLASVQSDLDDMANTIKDVQQPWKSPKAAEWDKKSLGAWFNERGLTSDAMALLKSAIHSTFSAEPSDLSLLYVIAYIASAGDAKNPGTFERLTSIQDGAQMYRVVGGTEILATKLADKLGNKNIVYNSPVKTVKKTSNGQYSVILRNGTAFASKSVVIAMSPPLAGRINYEPSLPAQRTQLCQRMVMGTVGKAISTYKTPFWRKQGLSGQVVSGTGTTRGVYDQSLSDNSVYALLSFIEADEMKRLNDAPVSQITSEVSKDLVNYFGPQAANVTSWTVFRWAHEEFSLGGYAAVAAPGILTQFGAALSAPVGNIFFAGTESADYWVGYIDGALRSGERAAKQAIASLA
ncbi:unnamed protein product [Tilletia laevis]|uniref:Amine oxidase n=3 Tax=Tilletia TaxID=13289 RepID=A0A8X7MYT0_9BASI|nr:hypothetical protein CF336_g519 [Tilletia laevis]KAE8254763.1 hypothetical protein A4X06_0g742 [Tilletia controversa]KAE8259888.1 hypothetical protein A4X03_0g3965 [Tilletia caries]KAE8208680.1 hypothetical protein CF335_g233 [Tilletia laevis]CAD6893742.1 unnamed protein product [Tilletia caries]